MTTPVPQGGSTGEARRCQGCDDRLPSANSANLCARCHRDQRDQLRTPPAQLRHEFFETDEFRAAFAEQHIGHVFKAYRNHPRHLTLYGRALTQELLARWLNLTQSKLSRIENGPAETNLFWLQNWARTLHLPQHLLWFDLPGQSRLTPPVSSGRDAAGLIDADTHNQILIANTGIDTAELVQRVRASAIDQPTIDALSITVEQMCCDYSHADARELMRKGQAWLRKVTELLGKQLTLPQHREVLHNAGLLALLVGCLEYDLGDQKAAQATRKMALQLGTESGDASIVGWAHEMLAWFNLTAGNYRAVIPLAQAGIIAAPSQSVAVQLYGQQAKAYARMGMANEVYEVLQRGSELLGDLPYPERPDNHFVVDPDKFDFYAMDTYRIVGRDDLAKRNAEEVIRRSVNADGFVVSPMRSTEAQLTLAVVAARAGDIEEAAAMGVKALGHGRQSRPSLLMVASELDDELSAYGARAGADFRDLFKLVKETKGQPSASGD
ncbi:helix-turn-helix domain-containing protein [Lentzea guizhouensis]|uniref:helix-turn-helix domain-containing protein n=1 Tax=Lentzea guizhouensis TaxID=1586287 RepID=UPI000A8E6937|nr:helix-turn-helix transcriptional regulator [Lentzea guizhouensis]